VSGFATRETLLLLLGGLIPETIGFAESSSASPSASESPSGLALEQRQRGAVEVFVLLVFLFLLLSVEQLFSILSISHPIQWRFTHAEISGHSPFI